jgi:GNAT superfamily N-acetyltransferase
MESDCKAVRDLHYFALGQTGALLPQSDLDTDLDDIKHLYIDDYGDFLVGILDGKLVCMGALLRKSYTLAEIKRMRVHPEYQHKGFGQEILDALIKRAFQLGYSQLCLNTTDRQFAAQKLYEKNGFWVTHRSLFSELELIFYEKQLEGK